MRSSPVRALRVEAGEMPLSLRRRLLCQKLFLKIHSVATHPLNNILITYKRVVEQRHPTTTPGFIEAANLLSGICEQGLTGPQSDPPLYSMLSHISCERFLYLQDIPPLYRNKIFQSDIYESYQGSTHIFVDGSKRGELVGGGIFCNQGRHFENCFKLNGSFSSYSAELVAILRALIIFKDSPAICLYTDCMSALMSLVAACRGDSRSYLSVSILQQLRTYIDRGTPIKLFWIPGHSGLAGNEKSDECARSGAIGGELLSFQPPVTDVQATLVAASKVKWQSEWQAAPETSLTRVQRNILPRPWFWGWTEARGLITTLCRIRIGHASYPVHLHRIGVADSPLCPCGRNGTLAHLILDCPTINQQRQVLIRNLKAEGYDMATGLDGLLMSNNKKVFCLIYHFLQAAGLKL